MKMIIALTSLITLSAFCMEPDFIAEQKKFERVKVEYKLSEQNEEGQAVLKIAVRAYVRFNSYLEFLEHEFYLYFRREIKSVFTLDTSNKE